MVEIEDRELKLLTINEVTKILKVSDEAVYGYISNGQLKAHRLGETGGKHSINRRPYRIWEADLLEFIDSGKFTLPSEKIGVRQVKSESNDNNESQ